MNWTFWIAAAVLAAITVTLMLRPLLRRHDDVASSAAYDLQVYKDQLSEVGRELEQGNLSPAEAKAAQIEIERRLLKAAEANAAARDARPNRPAKALAMVLTAVLPLGALSIYLYALGSPGLPSIPFAERQEERQQLNDRDRLIAELAQRMRERPEDPRGWEILARNYAMIGRFAEAAEAYGQAIARGADRPDLRSQRAETLVAAAQGVVTPAAQAEIRAALAADPTEPLARYYVGVMHEQAGEPRQAIETWAALLRDLPPDIVGREQIMERLRSVAGQARIDASQFQTASTVPPVGAPPPAPFVQGQGTGQPGPTQEQIQAAQDMSPEERMQMVRGMVEGLAARLEENPEDLDGWLRLARAYSVLGERADAVAALESALPLAQALPASDPRRQQVEQGLEVLRSGG